MTSTTIDIGAYYENSDIGAADSALGAANSNPGNIRAEYQAVINYVNSHGGVAGRQLVPVWYEEDIQNSADTSYQQMCATWTQDNKSFVFTLGGEAILDQCAAQEGAVVLYDGEITSGLTSATQNQYPMDVNETSTTIDDAMKITIEGLARQGYFSSGEKLGIVTWDDPNYTYGIKNAALPALATVGINNPPVEYVTSPQGYNDLGSTSASAGSAVLKFKSMGIDHVILFDGPSGVNSSGVLVLEFMQQANSQQYHPKFGLNSTSGFTGLASDYPQQEMVGSEGVSWEPVGDASPSDYPSSKLPPIGQRCLQIMSNAGDSVSAGSNAEDVQLAICDDLFFLQQALAKVTGPLNQKNALAAIEAMGSSFQPAETFGIDLSPSQRDGLQLVANMSFSSSCACYQYTSSPYKPS